VRKLSALVGAAVEEGGLSQEFVQFADVPGKLPCKLGASQL